MWIYGFVEVQANSSSVNYTYTASARNCTEPDRSGKRMCITFVLCALCAIDRYGIHILQHVPHDVRRMATVHRTCAQYTLELHTVHIMQIAINHTNVNSLKEYKNTHIL